MSHVRNWMLAVVALLAAIVVPLDARSDEPGSAGKGAAKPAAADPAKEPADKSGSSEAKDKRAKPAADDKSAKPAAPADDEAIPLVGWLELAGPLNDAPPPFAWVPESDAGMSVRSITAQLRHVAASKEHKGVVIYLDQPALSKSQIEDLSVAIAATRKAGKKVLFFAEAYDLDSYLLACSGDQILLQNKGFVELTGMGVEEYYLAGLFEKIGIKPDFVQTGQFKGADEMYMRKGPSPQWTENFDLLLDDMYGQVIERIAAARKLNRDKLEKAMEASLAMSDEELVKAGLIDKVTARDLVDVTETAFGDDFDWDDVMGQADAAAEMNLDNPFAIFKTLFAEPKPAIKRDTIAIVHMNGVITSGESSFGGMFDEASIGSKTAIEALNDARDNDLVKGVILRIDSPGGSALASEVIWQSVRELAKEKPVYVSVGSLAASGGYYIACSGKKIYASAGSIVGSIGVVSGKIAMGGLLEWAGIGVHRRSRGPHGDMFNSVEPFTPEQRKALSQMSQRIYEQFTDRVATGRGKKIADISKVAQGRLFTGRQAVKNGLIDAVGGMDLALKDLAAELKLEAGKYDVINLPEPMSLPQFLSQMLGVQMNAPRLSAEQAAALNLAKLAVGPRAWPAVRRALAGVSLLSRERVLAIMPHVVVVR